jgi:hypothetical protein
MLNQHFARLHFLAWFLIGGQRGSYFRPIRADVDVSSPGNFELFEAGHRAESSDDLFGNLAGRFAEFAGKFESDGERVFSELNFRGLLDDELG